MSGLFTRSAWFMLAVFAFIITPVQAQRYLASIIIDDIGQSFDRVERLVNTDIPLTLAILPKTLYARQIAEQAHDNGKEIMVHLPMQSIRHHKHSPGTLTLHMTEQRFVEEVKQNLASVPHARGVNNHMGSLMTRHPGYMSWLMQTLAGYDNLYFIDSRTTDKTIASGIAEEHGVPNAQRDVFLDPDFDRQTLEQQFQRFIDTARNHGTAIAIAHPHPHSIQYIFDNIGRLQQHGIKLVPVSELLKVQAQTRAKQTEDNRHASCTGSTCSGL